MEDQSLQQTVNNVDKSDKSKELIKRFGKLPKVKLPDFESMDKKQIISWIDQHYRSKEVLSGFIKSLYIVEQEMYFESSNNLSPHESLLSFPILEGVVTIDLTKPEEDQYTFKPNKILSDLIDTSDRKNTTKLKEFLDSRFYKMIETLYKLYN